MAHRTGTITATPGTGAAPDQVVRDALVNELRQQLYLKSVAQAKWRAHRHDCGQCQQVTQQAGPPAACRAGRQLLDRFLSHRDNAASVRQRLDTRARVDQQTLF